jgi:ATP/maltotriose-dependent transcriptional regulator MalT/two-component SAPR family response regulator
VGNGITALQAPAGYGKTVLLSQFTAEVDYHVCWVSLDSACAAPETFAERIAAALREQPDTTRFSTAARDGDLKAYMCVALREAIDASEQPLMLVFDNVHELRGANDAAELLGWLLATMPDGQEVLLSGRAAAPLREVDRRITAGECLLLTKDDLALTVEELETLAAHLKREFDAAEVHAATTGWPVAAAAMASGVISTGEPRKLEGAAAWERYLAREIWQSIPAAVQEVLMPLSVCESVDDALALELLGDEDYALLQEWIDQHDFLLDLHAEGSFEINPLLRSFMRNRYRRRHPDRFRETIAAVTRWLERRGAIGEALEIARTLEKGETLAELLERHSRQLLYHGAFALLSRGFEVLEPEHLESRPELGAIKARVFSHVGKPNQALEQAEAVLAVPEVPSTARVHALLARERAYRLLGRIAELPAVFEEIDGTLDLEDRALLAEVYYAEANYEIQGTSNFARGDELLHRSILNAQQTTFPNLELTARSTLGQLMAMRGDGPAAVNELTRAARGWRAARGTANLGWVLNNLGMAHLMVGDFESAIDVLEEARHEGETCENVRNEAYAIASLGDANLALGHYDEARRCFEEAIRLCATEVLDESLAALSIAGLAGAFLGLNDLQQADYFALRALPIAEISGSPLELGTCLLQYAMVKSAAGNHAGAITTGNEAIDLFHQVDARAALRTGHYRMGMLHFRARHRTEAQEELEHLAALMTEAWMTGLLLPPTREDPMFAQWVASRGILGPAFREMVDRHVITGIEKPEVAVSKLPRVVARSLGPVTVSVDGREVSDEDWASVRAKELFFLFLANRDGLRKEEAVEHLYPELSPEKCNSAFHSNVYRIRRALYQDSVVKRQGTYVLNPEGEFEWDVEEFEAALKDASQLVAGSPERAARYRSALQLYRGPFAEGFYSEWAETLRRRIDEHSQEALGTLAGYYAGREEYESAAACMEELLGRNRFNAEAAYQLAIYRVKSGQAAVALAGIDDYSRAYEQELGDRLPARFRQLRAQIAAGAIA